MSATSTQPSRTPSAAQARTRAVLWLSRNWDVLVAAAISSSGVLMLSRLASEGLGVSPDSVHYFSAAESILAGQGPVVTFGGSAPEIISWWPPGYPYALALSGYAAGTVASGAVLLNMVLLASSCLAAYALAREIAGPGIGSALAPLAMILSYRVTGAHTWMLSEPLFLTLILLHVVAAAAAVRRNSTTLILVASTLAGLSATVRYVGVAAAFALVLMVAYTRPLRRWHNLAAAVAPSLLLAYFSLTYGGSARRGLIWSPPTATDWASFFSTVSGWVSPLLAGRPAIFTSAAFALVAALAATALLAGPDPARYAALTALSLTGATLVSRVILDAAIVFYWRMFLPEQALVAVLAIALSALAAKHHPALRAAAPAVALVLSVGYLTHPPVGGVGYRDSGGHPVVEWTLAHADSQVCSNSADLAHYHTGQPVRYLPRTTDASGATNRNFEAVLVEICGEAVVVYELPRSRPSHFRTATLDQLQGLGFEVAELLPQGALLHPPECPLR